MKVPVAMELREAILFVGHLIKEGNMELADDTIDSILIEVSNATGNKENLKRQRDALLDQIEELKKENERLKNGSS